MRDTSRQGGVPGAFRAGRRLGLLVAGAVAVVAILAWGAFLLLGSSTSVIPQSGGTVSPTAATVTTPATSPMPSSSASPPVTPATPTPQSVVQVKAPLPTGPSLAIPSYQGRFADCPGGGTGAPPKVATGHIYPGTGNGKAIPVPLGRRDNVESVTRLGTDYLVVVAVDCRATDIRRYSPDGTIKDLSGTRPAFTGTVTTGADGSVAVSLKPGHLTLFGPSGRRLHTWTLTSFSTVGGGLVLPDHSVLTWASTGFGRARLFHLSLDGTITKPTAYERRAVNHAADVNPVNGDLLTSVSCGKDVLGRVVHGASVIGVQTQQRLWIDCGYQPRALQRWRYFSPDGSVVALVGQRKLDLVDAKTGAVLVSFRGRCFADCTNRISWEDATHLLVFGSPTYGKNLLPLVRYGLDGTVEKVPLLKAPDNSYGRGAWTVLW